MRVALITLVTLLVVSSVAAAPFADSTAEINSSVVEMAEEQEEEDEVDTELNKTYDNLSKYSSQPTQVYTGAAAPRVSLQQASTQQAGAQQGQAENKGLSTNAGIGIGVGAGAGVLGMAAAGLCIFKKCSFPKPGATKALDGITPTLENMGTSRTSAADNAALDAQKLIEEPRRKTTTQRHLSPLSADLKKEIRGLHNLNKPGGSGKVTGSPKNAHTESGHARNSTPRRRSYKGHGVGTGAQPFS